MESIAPPLLLADFVILSIENGQSVRAGIKLYLQSSINQDFNQNVGLWLFSLDQGLNVKSLVEGIESPYRRSLLTVLEVGLRGQPVLDRLVELRQDIASACESEINEFTSLLPLRLLIPVMFFMFPAFLILLLGPLLKSLATMLVQTGAQ